MRSGDVLSSGHRLVRRMTGGAERWLVVHPGFPGRSWMWEKEGRPRKMREEDGHPWVVLGEAPVDGGRVDALDGARLLAEVPAPMEADEARRFRDAVWELGRLGPAHATPETLLWDGRRLRILPAADPYPASEADRDALLHMWARFIGLYDGADRSWRGGQAAALTSAGVIRVWNEDACWLEAEGEALLAVVVDGLGGFRDGILAAREVAVAFVDAFQEDAPLEGWMALALEKGAGMAQHGVQNCCERGAGASAIAAIVADGVAELHHLGNCRAYVWRDGALAAVTREHTLVNHAIDLGKAPPDPARYRHILMRSYGGDDTAAEGELLTVPLPPGHRLVLCTDGLYDVVPDAQIAALLARARSPRQAVALLHGAAIEAGAPDNVAVLVVEGVGSPSR